VRLLISSGTWSFHEYECDRLESPRLPGFSLTFVSGAWSTCEGLSNTGTGLNFRMGGRSQGFKEGVGASTKFFPQGDVGKEQLSCRF